MTKVFRLRTGSQQSQTATEHWDQGIPDRDALEAGRRTEELSQQGRGFSTHVWRAATSLHCYRVEANSNTADFVGRLLGQDSLSLLYSAACSRQAQQIFPARKFSKRWDQQSLRANTSLDLSNTIKVRSVCFALSTCSSGRTLMPEAQVAHLVACPAPCPWQTPPGSLQACTSVYFLASFCS